MRILDKELYRSGMSFNDFLNKFTRNREYFLKRYTENLFASFGTRKKEALNIVERLKKGPKRKILVIAVDWCPDSYNTLGFYARLAEFLGWEIKIFEKETPPLIIGNFKKNGIKEAVPMYAFYNVDGDLLFWVSDRDETIEPWHKNWLAGRDYNSLLKSEKKQYLSDLNSYYDEEFFETTILNTLNRLINY